MVVHSTPVESLKIFGVLWEKNDHADGLLGVARFHLWHAAEEGHHEALPRRSAGGYWGREGRLRHVPHSEAHVVKATAHLSDLDGQD